jgi:hypothetical protein
LIIGAPSPNRRQIVIGTVTWLQASVLWSAGRGLQWDEIVPIKKILSRFRTGFVKGERYESGDPAIG